MFGKRQQEDNKETYIIAGLGNPGNEYKNTRHNLGFLTLDVLAEDLGIRISKSKHQALIGTGTVKGRKVILLKPQTYMNASGISLREALRYNKVDPQRLIVIYDDVDLPVGSLRIRKRGSAGTHNGMRSIVSEIGSEDFPRIRIGIGSSEHQDMVGHVLGKISGDEEELLKDAMKDAAEAAKTIITDGVDIAMNKYNTRRKG